MKFSSALDLQTFFTEIGAFGRLSENLGQDYKPTSEEMDTFIKRRTKYVGSMKDYRKSANQKSNWRENRAKMMKGIKAFHRSVEGKRFHRKLGRFIASRITRKSNEAMNYDGFLEHLDFLVGLNSVKQHLFVEMDYFHQAQEQIELEEMILDYSIPLLRSIEEKILQSSELNGDELSFMMDVTNPQDFILEYSAVISRPEDQVNRVYEEQVEKLLHEGIAKEDKEFYPILVDRLREYNWETT